MSTRSRTPDSVREWLRGQGFRVEFEAEAVLRSRGYQTTIGAMFPGPDGNLREVDVYATQCQVADPAAPRAKLQAAIVVECKYATDPWVLLGSKKLAEPHSVPQYVPRSENLPGRYRRSRTRGGASPTAPRRELYVSHGVKIARDKEAKNKSERAEPFCAVEKVVSIAWASVAEAPSLHGHRDIATHRVALPVVVVDGGLFVAEYRQADHDFSVRAVEFGHLLYNKPPHPTIAAIVTLDALGIYLDSLMPRITAWSRFAHEQAKPAEVDTALLGLHVGKLAALAKSRGLPGHTNGNG